MGLALDRSDRTPERLGRLTLGKVFVEAQDKNGALPWSESTKGSDDGKPQVHLVLLGCIATFGHRCGRQLADSATVSPTRNRLSVKGTSYVCLRLSVADPGPVQSGVGQRGLEKVLGKLHICGQKECGSQQGAFACLHEIAESCVPVHRTPSDTAVNAKPGWKVGS